MDKASGWLQIVCIAAIIVGIMGLMAGIFGLFTLAVGTIQGNFFESPAFSAPVDQLRATREMQQRTEEVARRWRPITVPLLAGNLIVSVCLIVGGIQTLRMRPRGRTLLLITFGAAVVLELIQLAPALLVQHETAAITSDYALEMVDSSTPKGKEPPPEARAMVKTMTTVVGIVGLVFIVLLNLAEIAFYVFGFVYLRRPNVRRRFVDPAVAELV